MKYKYLCLKPLLLAGSLLFLLSCADENSPKAVSQGSNQPEVKEQVNPFPFYKNITVRPGFNFEVLSWGKGVDTLGGYLILMSDSAKNDFKSLSNERNGIITDAWNMDLDNDGNPELYIEFLSKQNVRDLNVYEYSRNVFQKINFPSLSSRIKKNYGGKDKFFIKNGDLFRSFPIVNTEDTTQKTGALKILQYKLSGNSFSVDEVKD
ncbi:hypothetical protein AAKU52_001344 [Pedobacter sp. CG_S7]|uniref:hypothetical protein n=1 Tax=Pedobacter sp. CG_S7 TaxID=3143930 RepID=UPI00339501F7